MKEKLNLIFELVNDDMRSKICSILELETMNISVADKIDIESICLKLRCGMENFEKAWEETFALNERLISESGLEKKEI